jgi:hypothetical protein
VRPDADPGLGQPRRDIGGRHPVNVDQERRHPAGHTRQAVDGHRGRQAVEELAAERALIRCQAGDTAKRVEVGDRRVEAGQQLIRQRAGGERPAQRGSRRRPGLVGPPVLRDGLAGVRHAQVRAAELVRGADQHVGVDSAHVDRLVRRVVHRIHPGQRASLVRQFAYPGGVHDGADRVGGPRERDHLRPRPELALQVLEIQCGVIKQTDVPDHEVLVVSQLQPGRDPAVVVQVRHQDLVAGGKRPAGGPGQREIQRGHVRAEHHLVRIAAKEPGGVALGKCQDLAYPP